MKQLALQKKKRDRKAKVRSIIRYYPSIVEGIYHSNDNRRVFRILSLFHLFVVNCFVAFVVLFVQPK